MKELWLTPARARQGARARVTREKDGRTETVVVGVPPGVVDGQRVRVQFPSGSGMVKIRIDERPGSAAPTKDTHAPASSSASAAARSIAGRSEAPAMLVVPAFVGLSYDDARRVAEGIALDFTVEPTVVAFPADAEKIVAQSLPAGVVVAAGSPVTLTVSVAAGQLASEAVRKLRTRFEGSAEAHVSQTEGPSRLPRSAGIASTTRINDVLFLECYCPGCGYPERTALFADRRTVHCGTCDRRFVTDGAHLSVLRTWEDLGVQVGDWIWGEHLALIAASDRSYRAMWGEVVEIRPKRIVGGLRVRVRDEFHGGSLWLHSNVTLFGHWRHGRCLDGPARELRS